MALQGSVCAVFIIDKAVLKFLILLSIYIHTYTHVHTINLTCINGRKAFVCRSRPHLTFVHFSLELFKCMWEYFQLRLTRLVGNHKKCTEITYVFASARVHSKYLYTYMYMHVASSNEVTALQGAVCYI